jgi:hypothetical protein
MGIKRAQDDSVFFGVLELWLWLGDTTCIKRAKDDSVFFGKEDTASDCCLRMAFWTTRRLGLLRIVFHTEHHAKPGLGRGPTFVALVLRTLDLSEGRWLNGGFSTKVGHLRGLPLNSRDKIETIF